MKQKLKKTGSRFSGFWSKPKPAKSAAPAKVVSKKTRPADLVLTKYSGEPEIVARHAAWGAGRFWPKDEAFEQRVSRHFQLSADKIIAVLGCGTGASALNIAKHMPTFVHGYDWRANAEVTAEALISASGQGAKVLVRTIDIDTVFPPKTRSHGLIAIEPVLTYAQPKILDWLGLALISGSTAIFEEPSLEAGNSKISWFAGQDAEDSFWQNPGERESALQQAGFCVQNIKETTGGAMRALRAAIVKSEIAANELDDAIELAPILEPVRNFFIKEVDAAKNRLHALEVGDVAVYRYQVIKQRTDR